MRSVLSFLFAFCLIEDPSRRIFGQKLFLNQSKNSGQISANSIFLVALCNVGNGGERAGLEFVPSGVGVSVAWNLGYVQGCILGVSWAGYGTSWVWEAALLVFFVFVGSGWVFGTRDGNGVFGCRGQAG